jgi:hypothetical protein
MVLQNHSDAAYLATSEVVMSGAGGFMYIIWKSILI